MTEKIARRGVRTPQSYKPDVLERIKVEQVVNNEGVVLSEDNTVGEVCDWLSREQGHRANFFIVSNEQGAYKGILNASDLFNDYRIPDRKIGTLVKSRLVSVQLQDTLRLAAEIMAQESIDVLPVLSDSDKNIVGIVSYRDILTAYKHEFDEYERKRPNISLRRNGLKILLQGQKLLSPLKWKR